MKKIFSAVALACLVCSCSNTPGTDSPSALDSSSKARMNAVLERQDQATKARYPYRHPQETLNFFGIRPGMHVAEFLPGGGWYSQILVPYLGEDGALIGIDYPMELFTLFDFATPEFLQKRKQWGEEWTGNRSKWGGEDAAQMQAYSLDEIPANLHGTLDAVLFIRALHNLSRYESQGQYLSQALSTSFDLLKPGGIVGVVQHAAPDNRSDEWADGSRGYIKAQFLKNAFEKAGFEFVAESDINANPKDQPGEEDAVWRLPPSLATSQNDAELKAEYQRIGESNRMTLKFRKPAQ